LYRCVVCPQIERLVIFAGNIGAAKG